MIVAYCFASCLRFRHALGHRASDAIDDGGCKCGSSWVTTLNLDWLVTYCGLSVILISGIGVNMTTSWNAPIWFGILGVFFGVGYYLLECRSKSGEFVGEPEKSDPARDAKWPAEDPNLERWGAFVGLLYGLGLSLRKTLKGGANLYIGDEDYWDRVCWNWVAILMLVCMLAGIAWLLYTRLPRKFQGNAFPRAYGIIWLVLIAENVKVAQASSPARRSDRAYFMERFHVQSLLPRPLRPHGGHCLSLPISQDRLAATRIRLILEVTTATHQSRGSARLRDARLRRECWTIAWRPISSSSCPARWLAPASES